MKNIYDKILESLTKLHEFGIYHRDLHTGNILVKNSKRFGIKVKIIDFGKGMNKDMIANFYKQKDPMKTIRSIILQKGDSYLYRLSYRYLLH